MTKKKLIWVVILSAVFTNGIISAQTYGIMSASHVNNDIMWDNNTALYVWARSVNISGGPYVKTVTNTGIANFMGFGIARIPEGTYKDLSSYSDGDLFLTIVVQPRSLSRIEVGIKSGQSTEKWVFLSNDHVYSQVPKPNGEVEYNLRVPFRAFGDTPRIDFANISQFFMMRVVPTSSFTIPSSFGFTVSGIYWRRS